MQNTNKQGYLIVPLKLIAPPYTLAPIPAMTFCLIASLNQTTPCFASNEYIAAKLNTSPRTVQRSIQTLINKHLINRNIKHLSQSKKQRLLFLTPTGRQLIAEPSFKILDD